MNGFISKYKKTKPTFRGGPTNYNSVDATKKWVEYSLDIVDMNKLLLVEKDFNTKMDLLYCLDVAERKRAWHFKHPNFDAKLATMLFNKVKNIARTDNSTSVKNKFK